MNSVKSNMHRETGVSWVTLFASSGTLVCCALPILLVTLGMGATVATMTSMFPVLVVLSQYKAWVFALSGLMLILSTWLTYRPGQSCPTDPELARICNISKKWNRRIVNFSVVIWSIGFFAAYVALPLRIALGI